MWDGPPSLFDTSAPSTVIFVDIIKINQFSLNSQEAALPPWMGYAEDEENLKEQILALSSDERHFMRPPPGGVSYQFDYGTSYPIALATLEADPMLRVSVIQLQSRL